jgi:glycosyltransferase involved in cell wall biosynthesis
MKVAVYCHSIAPSIDGVCRRFTSILHELVREGHEVLLYTLEEDPQDIPAAITETIWLDFLLMPAYPNKRVAKPELRSLWIIFTSLQKFRPDYIHVTGDGISQLFALVGLILGIPVLGSFHTDILDLLSSHNANFFQLFSLQFKEMVDSFILDSCATTSASFAVSSSLPTFHSLLIFSSLQRKLRNQGLITEHIIITGVNTTNFHPNKKNLYVLSVNLHSPLLSSSLTLWSSPIPHYMIEH